MKRSSSKHTKCNHIVLKNIVEEDSSKYHIIIKKDKLVSTKKLVHHENAIDRDFNRIIKYFSQVPKREPNKAFKFKLL